MEAIILFQFTHSLELTAHRYRQMPIDPKTSVIITIDDAHLVKMESIVSALQAAGMQVTNVLQMSGVIMGEVSPGDLPTLRQIDGITGVEQDGTMDAI